LRHFCIAKTLQKLPENFELPPGVRRGEGVGGKQGFGRGKSICLRSFWIQWQSLQRHLQMTQTMCTGTLKHMTINGSIDGAAIQPGFPTSLTSLVPSDLTLDLDKAFLAVLPLKNLQVLNLSSNVITMKLFGQYSPRKFAIALPCLQRLTLCNIIALLDYKKFAELMQPYGLTVELKLLCKSVDSLIHAAPHWLQMTKQQTAKFGVYCAWTSWKSSHAVK